MRRLKRIALTGLALAAAGYAGLLICLFCLQRSLIFPAPPPEAVRPPPAGRVVEIPAPPGPVHALFVPPPTGKPTLVLFHGNGEQLADEAQQAARYSALGVGVYAIEFPGYGPSQGQTTSEQAIYGASEVALGHLVDALGVPRDQIILVGRSLGTGVAVEMARRGWGQRLVLLSAYTSIPDVAAHSYPFVPVHWLIRHPFDSLSKAPGIQMPVLVAHGDQDEVIPFAMGEQLARAFPHATFLPLAGVGHNRLFDRAPELYQRIVGFAEGR